MQPLVNCGTLTDKDMDFIDELQDRGFAVVIFTPEEVEGLSVRHFERMMARHGIDLIEEARAPHD
jgi:hypothetical protein